MFLPNVTRLLAQIQPTDVVLDIGGWAQPFRRANFVMDAFPYETRGWYAQVGLPASLGDGQECFTKDTWVQRDICAREPFPFADKSVDFVICSHVLEDVRDPLWVCSEMVRIGKRGYIEVPSRLSESIFNPKVNMAGTAHHRWLITIEGHKIVFEMKYHLIHRKGLHLPAYTQSVLKPEQHVQWLFWADTFGFEEASIPLGEEDIERRLRAFVVAHAPTVPIGHRWWWSARRFFAPLKRLVPGPVARRMAMAWRSSQAKSVHHCNP